MTTPKETCPKCGAQRTFGMAFACGTDPFKQSDRCRIAELQSEVERLSKSQLKTHGFDVEVSWYWGRTCQFRESAKFWSQTSDKEEIKKHILYLVNKIKDRYCFDCGDLNMPLNPSIGCVRITPSVKVDSEYIYDEEVLQNNLIQEHIAALLKKKGTE